MQEGWLEPLYYLCVREMSEGSVEAEEFGGHESPDVLPCDSAYSLLTRHHD